MVAVGPAEMRKKRTIAIFMPLDTMLVCGKKLKAVITFYNMVTLAKKVET
jgi:hypothetical protein